MEQNLKVNKEKVQNFIFKFKLYHCRKFLMKQLKKNKIYSYKMKKTIFLNINLRLMFYLKMTRVMKLEKK